jgi:phosphoribosylaminoimidazole-succinocarboxamide synthase
LENGGWNKQPPAPSLPTEIIEKTRQKYVTILKIITGKEL